MQTAQSRMDTIGASEISALFDENPYESRFSLLCKKTGLAPPEDFNEHTTRQQTGLDLERPVLEVWAKREGFEVLHNNESLRNKDLPGLSATPDGFVFWPGRQRETADVKTVRPHQRKAWLSGIPQHYWWQQQQQIMIDKAEAGWLIALFGVDEIAATRIEADKKAHAAIVREAGTFWRQAQGYLPWPSPDSHRATLDALMSQRRESKTIELSGYAMELDERLRANSKAMATLKKNIRADKAALLGCLGDADRGVWSNGVGYGVRLEQRKAHEVKASTFQKLYRFTSDDAQGEGEDE